MGRACVVCLNAFVVDVGSKCCDEPRAVRLLGARCVCLLYGLGAVEVNRDRADASWACLECADA